MPLSRKIFEAPTQYYKAGVVFLAWLNGHLTAFHPCRPACNRLADCSTMPISSAWRIRPMCSTSRSWLPSGCANLLAVLGVEQA